VSSLALSIPLTPSLIPNRSLVSFGPKQRALGEAAKTQEISNFRNTAGSLKRLLGRTLNDVEIQQVEKKFTHVNLVDVDGSVGVQVSQPHRIFFPRSSSRLAGLPPGRTRHIFCHTVGGHVSRQAT
jgi:Hsp70 protein